MAGNGVGDPRMGMGEPPPEEGFPNPDDLEPEDMIARMSRAPVTVREEVENHRQMAEFLQSQAKLAAEVAEMAELGLQLHEKARTRDLDVDDCVALLIGPEQQDFIDHLREKIEKPVSRGQVLHAALSTLHWKVDREAEGLRIVAVPQDVAEGGAPEEPWK